MIVLVHSTLKFEWIAILKALYCYQVMAGALKRASPDQHEEKTLLCALNDSNLPKFLAADAILFGGILSDLFPGVDLPVRDYDLMETSISRLNFLNTQISKNSKSCKKILIFWLYLTTFDWLYLT